MNRDDYDQVAALNASGYKGATLSEVTAIDELVDHAVAAGCPPPESSR